ncbi:MULTISPECIES: hypothetical protein [unclassified Streptomyces]|uniref:hypothetical protein n=1 Tax=unclassified Streptomyces TaxID=2593676 RepID=UPI00068A1726|nr:MULTISPECIES: hypothetical protein [unclassified Streptomyces]
MGLTIVPAFVGYTVTYRDGPRPAQRQERLSRVDRQISELYGALFARAEANGRIFDAFLRDLVIKHADLLSEPQMPPILLQLCVHVSGYEITVARWEQGSYGEHQSVVPFPSEETAAYARHGFTGPKPRARAAAGATAERRRSALTPSPSVTEARPSPVGRSDERAGPHPAAAARRRCRTPERRRGSTYSREPGARTQAPRPSAAEGKGDVPTRGRAVLRHRCAVTRRFTCRVF